MTRPAAVLLMLMLALLAGLVAPVQAQTAGASTTAVIPPQPTWLELNEEQRQILAPLADSWDRMENYRRKKWLGIAQRYPRMDENEQARVQRRMREWAEMTPQQRTEAREKFRNIKRLPPERKKAVKQKWQEYANLTDEQRQQFKDASQPKSQLPLVKGGNTPFLSLPLRRTLTPFVSHTGKVPRPRPPELPEAKKNTLENAPPFQLPRLRTRGDNTLPSLLPPMKKPRTSPAKKR